MIKKNLFLICLSTLTFLHGMEEPPGVILAEKRVINDVLWFHHFSDHGLYGGGIGGRRFGEWNRAMAQRMFQLLRSAESCGMLMKIFNKAQMSEYEKQMSEYEKLKRHRYLDDRQNDIQKYIYYLYPLFIELRKKLIEAGFKATHEDGSEVKGSTFYCLDVDFSELYDIKDHHIYDHNWR